jgi:hypothetical protein
MLSSYNQYVLIGADGSLILNTEDGCFVLDDVMYTAWQLSMEANVHDVTAFGEPTTLRHGLTGASGTISFQTQGNVSFNQTPIQSAQKIREYSISDMLKMIREKIADRQEG